MRSGLSGLKAVVSLFAVMALTGAKTNGCGPDLGGGEDCPEGTYFDGQSCVEIEQPEPICPDGSVEQQVCSGGGGVDPQNPEEIIFEEEQCWIECVPVDPGCPEGTVEQVVCEGYAGGEEGAPEPYPQEEFCYSECVPTSQCPPGSHEEWYCDPGCDPDSPEGGHCELYCVSDNPCGPDAYLETICSEEGCYETCTPINPCPPDSYLDYVCDEYGCYETCIPTEVCPPDSYLDYICDEQGCYETCTPIYDECPPGTQAQQTCWEDANGMGGGCSIECVPVDYTCPDGSPAQLVCAGSGGDPGTGGGGMGGAEPGVPPEFEQCWYECPSEESPCPPGWGVSQWCFEDQTCTTECIPPEAM